MIFDQTNLNFAKELRSNGKTFQAIGDHFGVTRQAVHQALLKEAPGVLGRPQTHGLTMNGECHVYHIWYEMMRRCFDPKTRSYRNYGARGITVCERWQDPLLFAEDMGPRPQGLTLERINNDGNYEPGNCKWATWEEQANNRRGNRRESFNGISLTVAQWSRQIGRPYAQVRYLLDHGWTIQKIMECAGPQQEQRRRVLTLENKNARGA